MNELTGHIQITEEKEKALIAKLLQFEEAVQSVAREGQPHIMCSYLFELAGIFSISTKLVQFWSQSKKALSRVV